MSCTCGVKGASSDARTDFQYAVKIVCGQIPTTKPTPLPPGRYFTATNVHNPSRCDTVTLRWKVALGLQAMRVGPVSSFAEATLGPDEALTIDCNDVKARLEKSGAPLPPYVEGWVVIETAAELDVVAVYASGNGGDDPTRTFHTERVPARCLPICEDFDLDISTGVADWNVKLPSAADFAKPILSQAHPAWAQALPGSMWLVPGGETVGDYTYRLSFKLCSGFTQPKLSLDMLADDVATVRLNGQPLTAPTPTATYLVHATWSATSGFKAGDNHLDVVVTNAISVTGLALRGSIEVRGGRCAGAPMPLLGCPRICYEVYTRHFITQSSGGWWSGEGCDGAEVGSTGQNRRVQAFRAHLSGPVPPGTTIEYRAHMQGSGWTSWMPESSICGVIVPHKRMEALEIRLINAPLCCRLSYSVHTRNDLLSGSGGGWGPWVASPQMAGTTGQNRRMEAVRASIVCG